MAGIQLINAVRHIKRFLSLSAEKDRLSITTLLLHFFAFGLFLASVVVYAILYSIYIALPNNDTAY